MTDREVIWAMEQFGGNFIQHLAAAYLAADAQNQYRIKVAFDREWRHYAELAEAADAEARRRRLE